MSFHPDGSTAGVSFIRTDSGAGEFLATIDPGTLDEMVVAELEMHPEGSYAENALRVLSRWANGDS
jgi:hypothetical protein